MFSFVFCGSGLAQRDAAVTECYLAQMKLYHAKKSQTTVDVVYVHSGGPHEQTHRQAWLLVYPQENEAEILELASQEAFSKKRVLPEKVDKQVLANHPKPEDLPFFAELNKLKLAVPIATKTATWGDTGLPSHLPKGVSNNGFPFRFDLDNQTVFDAVYELEGCDKSNKIVYGEPPKSKWYQDRFKRSKISTTSQVISTTKLCLPISGRCLGS